MANGLMSYVYNKVANDKESNQTLYYGYFDENRDFILYKPDLSSNEDTKNIDQLVPIPFSELPLAENRSKNKIKSKNYCLMTYQYFKCFIYYKA